MATMNVEKFNALVAWGQYQHWAHMHFERFRDLAADCAETEKIGAACHWLASEFVVLEGWRELGILNDRISALLSSYPENTEALRRCRNAVYHYQRSPLDPRIARILGDENESLRWAIALHFEFQGALLRIFDAMRLTGATGREASLTLAGAIGWLPQHPFADAVQRLEDACRAFEQAVSDADSSIARDARASIDAARATAAPMDMYPATAALSRLRGQGS